MESSFSDEMREISRMVEILASQRDDALKELKVAREEVEILRLELAEAQKDLHKKNLDVEFLTLSHKLADSPQSLAEARATVRRLKAGVEKAISLLRDDAGI